MSMTAFQEKKYWRRWAAVCRANRWRWAQGFLDADAVRDASPHHAAVWEIADALAARADCAPAADHLRHACHVHALGRDLGHKSFTNAHFNRLLTLWGNERDQAGLLLAPECLASDIAWSHPEHQTRASRSWTIAHRCVPSYVHAVARDHFGVADWETLADAHLDQLYTLLQDRPNAWRRNVRPLEAVPVAAGVGDEDPDWSVA